MSRAPQKFNPALPARNLNQPPLDPKQKAALISASYTKQFKHKHVQEYGRSKLQQSLPSIQKPYDNTPVTKTSQNQSPNISSDSFSQNPSTSYMIKTIETALLLPRSHSRSASSQTDINQMKQVEYERNINTNIPKSASTSPSYTKQFKHNHIQEYGRSKLQQPLPSIQKPYDNTPVTKTSQNQSPNISSDSFSQNPSTSYMIKTIETPLLLPRSHSRATSSQTDINQMQQVEYERNINTNIPKSVSSPSFETSVELQNGSNISVQHRIVREFHRSPSNHVRRVRLGFRSAQVLFNALVLLAMGGAIFAYFKVYQLIRITNMTPVNITPVSQIVIDDLIANDAPAICLPVTVNFCEQHKVPYNYTLFPNFIGHFGQSEVQQKLEVFDAVIDVRCYELVALFLCSVFVPKCGPSGVPVRPCRSLCHESKRRCGFFLDVFGLELPDYIWKCENFPENDDPDVCIGHREVKEAKVRAANPVCPSDFRCDVKRCIPKDWRCDGHVDCKDQSDELNCDSCGLGMIYCGENRCIMQGHVCDGHVDCPWAQDERNCLRLSERNGDEGRGQLEIFRPKQQQWVPACVSHWDPSTSPDATCSLLGYSSSNGSQFMKGTVIKKPQISTTTTNMWRKHHNKRPKNMLRDFDLCRDKAYSTVDITCTNYMCGKTRKPYAERAAKDRVGEMTSMPGDWPFLAALRGGPEELFYCAGVLIADQWVLTASHCVGNQSDVSGWTIDLGITKSPSHSYYGQKIDVKRVVPHPNYNLGIAHDNDVALFQLSARVNFHDHLLPVCLPSANKELLPGTACTVIGWGKKEDTKISEYEPQVHEVEVLVLNRELCNTWLKNRKLNMSEGMMCAGYEEGGKDACQGDSGGPLLCRDEAHRWFVGGIISWGINCAHPHLPGVYANVPKYIPWILQQMQYYGD